MTVAQLQQETRQHARMILLGRQARDQAAMHRLETRWGCTLGELRARYLACGNEDFLADDDLCAGRGIDIGRTRH
jgi:hypothetical protein